MIKITTVLLVLLLLIALESNSQTVAVYGGSPYYFLNNEPYSSNTKVVNKPNYLFGFSVSKYFENISVEIGYSYSSKNFEYDFSSLENNLVSREIRSNINSIPILVSPRLFSNRRNIYSAVTGVIIQKPGKYTEKSFFRDGKVIENDGSRFDFKFGASIRLGAKYTRVLNNNFLFFSSLNTTYKVLNDFESDRPATTPANDKFSISLTVGVEMLFNKDLKYFRWNKVNR
jgi:hypothetical protein